MSRKRTAINMASWSKKDKESFSKGAMSGGSILPDSPKAVAEPDLNEVDPTHGEYGETDDKVVAQQKANLADPSRAAALEKMVVARRKFLGKK